MLPSHADMHLPPCCIIWVAALTAIPDCLTVCTCCCCLLVLQVLLNEYKSFGSQREASAQAACSKLEAELKRMQVNNLECAS